jgi:hypothetical protein
MVGMLVHDDNHIVVRGPAQPKIIDRSAVSERRAFRSQQVSSGLGPMAFVVLISLCSRSSALDASTQAARGVADDPAALVRRAAQNAMAEKSHHQPLRYHVRKVDKRSDTIKEIVETKDGDMARLIAIDGKPLSKEADQAELHRLNYLSDHPKLQEHRRKRKQEESDRVNRLMRLLPEAFLYRYEGMTPCKSGQCYRLGFMPNPQFDPPSEEAKIFRGMAGEVWIDPAEERMVKLNAHLIEEVDFGWGIIGTLRKGGTILLEQTHVGGYQWELTHMKLSLTGRALLIKSLDIQMSEDKSEFSPVSPRMSYQQAIQLLENP